MGIIELANVHKSYGEVEVIKGVSLRAEEGEFVVFVGPSGCGKSTLLRMIAGLEKTNSGQISIDGADITSLEPYDRNLSMVFQSYALYPHMSVYDNIAFALKTAGLDKQTIKEKVDSASEMLKLSDYLDRKPKELSGGQRQRVAIGRAIVREPAGFLFDEPLSNLDAALRTQTRIEIATLHKQLGATMIYVTHDQVEAMTLADKIVVLCDGKIMQVGSPRELYEKPDNVFVAQFIGSPKMNLIEYNRENPSFKSLMPIINALSVEPTFIGIRPENVSLVEPNLSDMNGIVTHNEYYGSDNNTFVNIEGLELFNIRLDGKIKLVKDQKVNLKFDSDCLHFFDSNNQRINN